eukprot:5325446-Amphidinium_carterae.1
MSQWRHWIVLVVFLVTSCGRLLMLLSCSSQDIVWTIALEKLGHPRGASNCGKSDAETHVLSWSIC